jgi:hypothetical protein
VTTRLRWALRPPTYCRARHVPSVHPHRLGAPSLGRLRSSVSARSRERERAGLKNRQFWRRSVLPHAGTVECSGDAGGASNSAEIASADRTAVVLRPPSKITSGLCRAANGFTDNAAVAFPWRCSSNGVNTTFGRSGRRHIVDTTPGRDVRAVAGARAGIVGGFLPRCEHPPEGARVSG